MNEKYWLEGKRIVDLTCILHPGKEKRRLKIKKKTFKFDGSTWYDIDMMSHLGTHVEVPLHWFKRGKDISQLPVETFFGKAVLLYLDFKKPDQPITEVILEKTSKGKKLQGAIVILRSPYKAEPFLYKPDDRPYITPAAAKWFIKKKIKMLGWDNTIAIEESPENTSKIHQLLLGKDIPFLEVLTNLDKLKKKEFFLIALPLRIAKLDACPVRAIAIER